MRSKQCFQITVEGPGESFQIIRDALDTARLIKSEILIKSDIAKADSFTSQIQVQQLTSQFNLENIELVSDQLKITHAQASRIFDILLLYLIDDEDHNMMTAFKGYYKRKLNDQNSKKLIQKTPKKHIEFYGKIQEVNPNDFKSISDERCKFLICLQRFLINFFQLLRRYRRLLIITLRMIIYL